MTTVDAKIKDNFIATFASEDDFLIYLSSFAPWGKWKALYRTVYPLSTRPTKDQYEEYKLKAVFDLPRILAETPMNTGITLAEFLELNLPALSLFETTSPDAPP